MYLFWFCFLLLFFAACCGLRCSGGQSWKLSTRIRDKWQKLSWARLVVSPCVEIMRWFLLKTEFCSFSQLCSTAIARAVISLVSVSVSFLHSCSGAFNSFPKTFLPQVQSSFYTPRRAEISLCCEPKECWLKMGEYSWFSNGKLWQSESNFFNFSNW